MNDAYAQSHGKPHADLLPFGALVSEQVRWPVPTMSEGTLAKRFFHLARAYCRGHLQVAPGVWTEEVIVVYVPLTPDDPRVLTLLAEVTPSDQDQADAAAIEQSRIAFCIAQGRSD